MFGFLLALLLLDGLILGVVVLLQSGKGGGLASMGGGAGTDTLIGGRQAATILTKASWISGGLFMGIALILSILSSRQSQPSSVLREEFRQQPAPAQQAPGAVQLPGTQAPAEGAPAPAEGGAQPSQTNQ